MSLPWCHKIGYRSLNGTGVTFQFLVLKTSGCMNCGYKHQKRSLWRRKMTCGKLWIPSEFLSQQIRNVFCAFNFLASCIWFLHVCSFLNLIMKQCLGGHYLHFIGYFSIWYKWRTLYAPFLFFHARNKFLWYPSRQVLFVTQRHGNFWVLSIKKSWYLCLLRSCIRIRAGPLSS